MSRAPGRRRARGFTLIEAVVVLLLISIVSAASLAWYGTTTSPEGDAAAKTALASFVSMQDQAFAENGQQLTADQLSVQDYTRVYSEVDPSTGPLEVSTHAVGSTAYAAAASGGGTCWRVRVELAPTPTSPPLLWYVETIGPAGLCEASDVSGVEANITDPGSTAEGTSPSNPITL